MRVSFFWLVSLFIVNCSFSQISNSNKTSDTISSHHFFKDSLICINYRMLPEVARYSSRYKILNSVNSDDRPIEINYSLQNFLKTQNYSDSSLLVCYNLVKENMTGGKGLYSDLASYSPVSEKELFYGIWRSQLTKSTSEDEIRQSMIDGTNTLIGKGYSDLGNDFLPFITVLMEEEHLVNYDVTRTYGFRNGSKGILTSVEILNALGSQDSRNKAGVCRDIHETGRDLLKPMCEVYFDHFYPDRKIDFDDYLFLQSWTTDASQHVTLSLINPLNTKEVYELDWGRVIERKNINGYNNGRLYGNTFRIWQYNKEKQISMPVDFKRTEFGKILDEDILTSEEYQQFNGIYDEEYYSNIRYIKRMDRYGDLNFSIGTYYPDQKYLLTSYLLHTKKKRIIKFLNHSNLIVLQTIIHEDTRKKELLYPQRDWQSAHSLMFVPRIISKFETKKIRIAKNITFNTYFNQQLDIFLIFSKFYLEDNTDSTDYRENSHSGDGNLSFSNGFNIDYYSNNKSFFSSFTLQGRSCALPNDIRLLSPNPTVLLSNICFITPAIDAITNTVINFNRNSNLSINTIFEFTNKNATIFSGSVSAKIGVARNLCFIASMGGTDQLNGIHYFWYPASKKWISVQINHLSNVLSLSLLKTPENQLSLNISFRKYLK
jgi:hypothetical protein